MNTNANGNLTSVSPPLTDHVVLVILLFYDTKLAPKWRGTISSVGEVLMAMVMVIVAVAVVVVVVVGILYYTSCSTVTSRMSVH